MRDIRVALLEKLTPLSWIAVAGFALALATFASACARVRPWQRGELASPAMQFQMSPIGSAQLDSVVEITEGGTFGSAGPGSAGAGCGCH
jgi:hypothetical protein